MPPPAGPSTVTGSSSPSDPGAVKPTTPVVSPIDSGAVKPTTPITPAAGTSATPSEPKTQSPQDKSDKTKSDSPAKIAYDAAVAADKTAYAWWLRMKTEILKDDETITKYEEMLKSSPSVEQGNAPAQLSADKVYEVLNPKIVRAVESLPENLKEGLEQYLKDARKEVLELRKAQAASCDGDSKAKADSKVKDISNKMAEAVSKEEIQTNKIQVEELKVVVEQEIITWEVPSKSPAVTDVVEWFKAQVETTKAKLATASQTLKEAKDARKSAFETLVQELNKADGSTSADLLKLVSDEEKERLEDDKKYEEEKQKFEEEQKLKGTAAQLAASGVQNPLSPEAAALGAPSPPPVNTPPPAASPAGDALAGQLSNPLISAAVPPARAPAGPLSNPLISAAVPLAGAPVPVIAGTVPVSVAPIAASSPAPSSIAGSSSVVGPGCYQLTGNATAGFESIPDHRFIAFYHPGTNTPWDDKCGCGEFGNFFDMGADALTITPPNGPNSFLNPNSFKNSEAAFQALKFWDQAAQFRTCNGEEAFGLKTKLLAQGPDWTFCGTGGNWAGMLLVLRAKFGIKKYRDKLISTGNKFLLEHNNEPGKDAVWSDNNDGTGTNWLGLQLMLLRDLYINDQDPKGVPGTWTSYLVSQCGLNRKTGAFGVDECNQIIPDGSNKWSKLVKRFADGVSGVEECARPACNRRAKTEFSGYCSTVCFQNSSFPRPVCRRTSCVKLTHNGLEGYCSKKCNPLLTEDVLRRFDEGRKPCSCCVTPVQSTSPQIYCLNPSCNSNSGGPRLTWDGNPGFCKTGCRSAVRA